MQARYEPLHSFGGAAGLMRQPRSSSKGSNYVAEYGFSRQGAEALRKGLQGASASDRGESATLSSRGLSSSNGQVSRTASSASVAQLSYTALILANSNSRNTSPATQHSGLAPHADKQVLIHCLRRFVLEGTVVGRYFGAWRRFWEQGEKRHAILLSLRRMSQASLLGLVQRCYSRLLRKVVHKRAALALPQLAAAASLSLGYRALHQWRYTVQIAQTERRVVPHLELFARKATLRLAQQVFGSWLRLVAKRRRQATALCSITSQSALAVLSMYYSRWQRKRNWAAKLSALARLGRRVQRENARSCLRLWTLTTVRKQLAGRCEQFHLSLVVRRYFIEWGAGVQKKLLARALEQRNLECVALSAFNKWGCWLSRRIVAEKEEQRQVILLLRVYFIKWRRANTVRKLSYATFMARKRSESQNTLIVDSL